VNRAAAPARVVAEAVLAWAVVRASLAWPVVRASFGRTLVVVALAAAVALVGADVVEWLAQAASDVATVVATTFHGNVLALLLAVVAGSATRLLRAACGAAEAVSSRYPSPFVGGFAASSPLLTEGLRGRAPPGRRAPVPHP
jgi:hypothetical protein